jgi:SAM-dependent methyltransferase
LLGPHAVGIDITVEDRPMIAARAQELPFADASFDAVACHLAFMLFDDIEQVVAEIARVLRPGGTFIALLGGGPTVDGHDAFHVAVDHMKAGRAFGDPRSKSEAGWRALFANGWSVPVFERWVVDANGTFEEVWRFLGASYSAADTTAMRHAVRARFPDDPVPLHIAMYFASARRADHETLDR